MSGKLEDGATGGDAPSQGTLRLKPGVADKRADGSVEVDVFDFRLPCRYFRARYKVAETGIFSLTTEFLLRFLHAAGSATIGDVGAFFGFDANEVTHAVAAAVSQGYVEHQPEGRLTLSGAGLATFVSGDKRPHVYEVHERTDAFMLDLISFCPAQGARSDDFARNLPELAPAREDALSIQTASTEARKAFQRHFDDLPLRQDRNSADRGRMLYSVDEVRSEGRGESVIPATLRLRLDGSGGPEPDLAAWLTGVDLDRRAKVVSSVADRVDEFGVPRGWTPPEAFGALAAIAPEQVGRYMLGGQLNVRSYVAVAASRTAELGSERSTIRVAGGLCTEANTRSLLAAATLIGQSGHGDGGEAIWLAPGLSHWGASRQFPALVPTVVQALRQSIDGQEQTAGSGFVALSPPTSKDATRRLEKAAVAVLHMGHRCSPPGLEILLWPGRLAAVLVHSVPDGSSGYPVPCGIISVDSLVLGRVEAELSGVLDRVRLLGSDKPNQPAVLARLQDNLDGMRNTSSDRGEDG